MPSFIAYLRVSTQKQGASGLGLEGQQAAIQRFLGPSDRLVASYVEIESGRLCERPRLAEAMAECRRTGARLLIAKLDRLARSVRFISTLMESDIGFVACDMPDADPFRMHIEAAISEEEARKISARTRAALTAAKARGVRLGGWRGRHLTASERAKGSALANAGRAAEARTRALEIAPHIEVARAAGSHTPSAIAKALNAQGITTYAGASWSAVQVSRALSRIAV